jgi:Alpha/beta hydrolase domain
MTCRLPLVLAALIVAAPLQARVISFEIEKQAPYGSFNGVEFVRIEAKVRGELTREDRIPDVEKAAGGRAVYETRVLLIAPAARANGALLLDVPNRGRVISGALYNGLREPPTGVGSVDAGTGFLQRNGYALASVTWEYGEGFGAPKFRDAAGEERAIEAAAFGAIRDVAIYLRDARADDAGRPNPLAGMVDRAYATGFSQTARFLRTYLTQGYNTVNGRMVFAGLHLHAGASGQMPILEAGKGARSVTASPTPNFTQPDMRGVQEAPFTYAEIVGAMRARGEPLPKIAVTNMTTDYLSLRASLSRTGAEGTAEAPLPENVRMYDVAGASHSLNTQPSHADCALPLARLDYRPVMRVTLVNLDAWAARGVEPPASALMPLAADTVDAKVLRAPAHLPKAVILAPRRGPDGNFAGGLRLPEVEAPLGVHGVQNTVDKDPCRLGAGYEAYPPATLKARYGSPTEYAKRVSEASGRLVERRLLLLEDARAIDQAVRDLRWED